MEKRRIVLSLICVIGLLTIFISITILANISSKSLNQNSSKREYSVDQSSLSNENLEEEKNSNMESNIQNKDEDDTSKNEENQNTQLNNVSNKNTNAKININSNSNKVSNSNKSSNTNKNTSNNKTNGNISSTNVTPSNSNKPSNTNSQNNDAKEWEEFINSEAVYKILGGHKPDFYSESEAKKKQKELTSMGYISSLKYACMPLSTGEKCVYSVVSKTGKNECNNNPSIEYDWRKLSKMGVIDFLVSKEYNCEGLTDPYSGKSY